MHDYSYSAHLVITEGYEDRLDMTITCQNAQQLLRAKDTIADQMNTYICTPRTSPGIGSYRSRSPPSSPRKASRVPSWTSTERP